MVIGLKNKKHILIVDDVTTNLRCLGEILKEEYSLTMAKSGMQALSMAKRIHPDLVMLDVKMPGMDGYETMEKMLSDPDCCDIPVIFFTADRDNQSELRGLKLGARDFIRKPYEPSVMLERIERVLMQDERNKKLELSAMKDPLTGLWNRNYLQREIEKFVSAKATGSFLILDLDNFKGINDTYGHVVGDAALVAFANTLSKFVHKDDVVARIGGDEFAVFLKNCFGKELLSDRISNLIEEVEKQLSIIKEDDTVSSVSIGISALPKDGKNFTELYNNADKALYYVKRNGKSGFHFYDEDEKYSFVEEENEAVIDLSQLKNYIDEKDADGGPFKVEYGSFKNIYQFLKRYVARTGVNIQLLLFTLKDLAMSVTSTKDIDNSMSILEESIKLSLRKNDVSTAYSKSQYLVILMDVNDKNRSIVIDRIMNNWNERNKSENVLLKYDIEEIMQDGE